MLSKALLPLLSLSLSFFLSTSTSIDPFETETQPIPLPQAAPPPFSPLDYIVDSFKDPFARRPLSPPAIRALGEHLLDIANKDCDLSLPPLTTISITVDEIRQKAGDCSEYMAASVIAGLPSIEAVYSECR